MSEPGHRFAYGEDPEPDGRFIAFDFMIEGRAGGGTSLRMVTSGFLPGDDWADEFELKYRRVDGYSIKARLKEARERALARVR